MTTTNDNRTCDLADGRPVEFEGVHYHPHGPSFPVYYCGPCAEDAGIERLGLTRVAAAPRYGCPNCGAEWADPTDGPMDGLDRWRWGCDCPYYLIVPSLGGRAQHSIVFAVELEDESPIETTMRPLTGWLMGWAFALEVDGAEVPIFAVATYSGTVEPAFVEGA